uniref:hypothetical protein n=1 Tax=uncultured Sphingomonas sp. TaxID=158754 RepID=UPI0035CB8C75
MKASEILRSLIAAIVLTPNDADLSIDVQGDLAGNLAIATTQNAKSPAAFATGKSQFELVAGTRFHFNLRTGYARQTIVRFAANYALYVALFRAAARSR